MDGVEHDVTHIERIMIKRLGDELLRSIFESGVYATGVMPSPAECIDIVHEHGDDMWDVISEVAGFEGVPQRIRETALGTIESYAEWCVAFVGEFLNQTAYHRGVVMGWEQ